MLVLPAFCFAACGGIAGVAMTRLEETEILVQIEHMTARINASKQRLEAEKEELRALIRSLGDDVLRDVEGATRN